jgi:hypothetical protein
MFFDTLLNWVDDCRRHPSALKSLRAAQKKELRTATRKISRETFLRAMMFVLQSLCISYNYVDIVIYQKINWSFLLARRRNIHTHPHTFTFTKTLRRIIDWDSWKVKTFFAGKKEGFWNEIEVWKTMRISSTRN